MKIRPVGAELFHVDSRADGRMAITKLVFAFRNFSNAPENEWRCNSRPYMFLWCS